MLLDTSHFKLENVLLRIGFVSQHRRIKHNPFPEKDLASSHPSKTGFVLQSQPCSALRPMVSSLSPSPHPNWLCFTRPHLPLGHATALSHPSFRTPKPPPHPIGFVPQTRQGILLQPKASGLPPSLQELALFRSFVALPVPAFHGRGLALFRTDGSATMWPSRPRLGSPPRAGVLLDTPSNWLRFANNSCWSRPASVLHSALRIPRAPGPPDWLCFAELGIH